MAGKTARKAQVRRTKNILDFLAAGETPEITAIKTGASITEVEKVLHKAGIETSSKQEQPTDRKE
jgi:hypothetical protein